ncbi:hypothetical protein RHGRI_004753 [Rhododendron griersonianum]|uniref:Uncharacterized protein n=1 Tax=Rhododendron griersonianum TaxID=479676 RepID=A0AAV6LAQ9_9ERIC|nr:hypothetical protein RHGRI_004753 [Rhododendron griersonianum]
METQNIVTEQSTVRETANEPVIPEKNNAVGDANIEANVDAPSNTPPEVQNLD